MPTFGGAPFNPDNLTIGVNDSGEVQVKTSGIIDNLTVVSDSNTNTINLNTSVNNTATNNNVPMLKYILVFE